MLHLLLSCLDRMTRVAQDLQVRDVVSPSIFSRYDMVDISTTYNFRAYGVLSKGVGAQRRTTQHEFSESTPVSRVEVVLHSMRSTAPTTHERRAVRKSAWSQQSIRHSSLTLSERAWCESQKCATCFHYGIPLVECQVTQIRNTATKPSGTKGPDQSITTMKNPVANSDRNPSVRTALASSLFMLIKELSLH